jgi:Domain of unknown function (DUF4399)
MAVYESSFPSFANLASGAVSLMICVATSGIAHGQTRSEPTPSPAGAAVYFIDLKNGDTLPPRATIRFGLRGMGVAPAGFEKANTGHHHLLIDAPLPPLDQPIPNDFNHLHFGAGQTEARITLPLGTHTLRLLLGDENHMAHLPPVYSRPITVTVTATGRKPIARTIRRPPA